MITAGPGTGKTRVLLWRTVNLIVCHEVKPEEIFLGTFTEKAARQLRQGLTAYLSEASKLTERIYHFSRMYIGTVHSMCRRILSDRCFSRERMRPGNVKLIDELDQYFLVLDEWDELLEAAGFKREGNETITEYLTGRRSNSRHAAAAAAISFFNRLSEECFDPEEALSKRCDGTLQKLLRMYQAYRDLRVTDLSLLQQAALDHCRANNGTREVFHHAIVDEYQDTNHVQESLFFHLASGHRNLCVVGDDDQALYRFRGATVENFVEFEDRCREHLGQAPRTIHLGTNYRSRRAIVKFYSDFIQSPHFDWSKGLGKKGAYRISKQIVAHSKDNTPAVVASAPAAPDEVCAEVAGLVRRLIDEGKVADPNQIAFLYPSLKSDKVEPMINALKNKGLKVYAPRAGRFLDGEEALDVFGVFLVLFGSPASEKASPGMQEFFDWVQKALDRGNAIVRKDGRSRISSRSARNRSSVRSPIANTSSPLWASRISQSQSPTRLSPA
ncbi:MAG: ATP-dependent helicase [Nitrospira sp.]|nr:ATP-dependent helicase [Nitrospira sp.]